MYLLLWSLHVSIKMYGIPRTKYEKITSWLPLSVYEKIMWRNIRTQVNNELGKYNYLTLFSVQNNSRFVLSVII